jgi:hypothetical protein
VDVVVGPGVPVNGNPGGVSLGVEGAGGGVRLIGVDGHGGVAVGLEVGAPGLVGLVPVAGGLGVVPNGVTYRLNLLVLPRSTRLIQSPCREATDKILLKSGASTGLSQLKILSIPLQNPPCLTTF